MVPWLHSAWEFLSCNQYSAPGPRGCLEGKLLLGPGSCLKLQDTPAFAQGLLGMFCETTIITTSTSFITPCSHRNINKYYIKHGRQCFIGLSRHHEESCKYDAQEHIFYEMRGVWRAGETLSGVFDIFPESIQKLRSWRNKIIKIDPN